jgi:hypothetical protein
MPKIFPYNRFTMLVRRRRCPYSANVHVLTPNLSLAETYEVPLQISSQSQTELTFRVLPLKLSAVKSFRSTKRSCRSRGLASSSSGGTRSTRRPKYRCPGTRPRLRIGVSLSPYKLHHRTAR